ncbi:uncharacterized protein LOC107045302 [Diachasma alloeum]|uniref:uncharacterized protein LOC107045302 n=1 Tax=Diachasma alloeum TaxID=454923 RepID=UPI000738518D|nr:uncharacterized protein LOC107045302 [Diachasma alloeum]
MTLLRTLAQDIQHLVYADDLQIYLRFSRKDLEDATVRMGDAARCIMDWALRNRLHLNVAKTKAIIFGSQSYVNDVYSLPGRSISIGDSTLPFETSVRSLGVVLDSKLTWKEHITSISQRVGSVMFRFRFFRASTTFELRKHLIETLVFPLVDYCCLVYGGLSAELSLRIQRLVNMGVRFVFGVRRDEHIAPFRGRMGWMTCEARRNYFLACLTYRILRSGEPSYLADFFVANHSVRPVRGEVCPLLIKPFRTESLRRSFHVSAAYLWNSLPSSIRDLPTILSFKIALRTFLSDNP